MNVISGCCQATAITPPNDTLAVVISNEWVNEEYKRLVLQADGAACQSQPGQFFNLLCPSEGEHKPYFRRPMSTYKADPTNGQVEFLYKVTGKGTYGLETLRESQTLEILGPLGKGFDLESSWNHMIIVARGVGLATLAPLAEAAHQLGIRLTAVLSARSEKSLLSRERFASLGADVQVVLDEDGSSSPEQLEQLLRQIIAREETNALFTCGSKRLTRLLKKLSAELGLVGQVALEQQMVCGLGMCQCCVEVFEVDGLKVGKRVCLEGPVFDLAEVV
ncbi:dihydroorotate dehydrogenase electron transfer subunit [Pseudomonas auratipiscis]|uniref:Dihydroorotate dehydrogenase electron transfer subunit n=1 Tax=Pseudomonas auratipiscis TaxID=3115853 RepID=A0AB35WSQ2_9PSED|nr:MULTISPECIES: dihydroorotate dehydrogenase electron transfer subunit [unclassified Pseudomonas]MEE1866988.1 dihydroorotate dehydrogenase electron transfer subunit [Pseudomonas sp. 120P]MEE1957815.1 dihydroorotate dehydrogenase electron transfer subunit [Pseudomonas sp. 119P]